MRDVALYATIMSDDKLRLPNRRVRILDGCGSPKMAVCQHVLIVCAARALILT